LYPVGRDQRTAMVREDRGRRTRRVRAQVVYQCARGPNRGMITTPNVSGKPGQAPKRADKGAAERDADVE
jgi:hypothetical protein